MSIRPFFILVWMVAWLQVLSAAQSAPPQNPAPQNPPPQASASQTADDNGARTAPAAALSALAGMETGGDADDASNDLPRMPALLGGKGVSSAFLSELEKSNYLRAGVNVGAVYDDNALLAATAPQVSNTGESIFPNISIEESSSRIHWLLGYAGGLTVNQKITSQDQGSHNLNFDSEYRLSPHVNLRIAENFSMITGFFDAGNGSDVVSGPGGPNESLIYPQSTQRSSLTTVETNYHFALNDVIGASGSFYDLHFSNVPEGTELANPQTASGSAFWLHRIFRGDWAGVSYRFDRLTYSPGGGETQVHSIFAVNTLNLSKRFTLTGFVGPQYSENQVLGTGTQLTANDWSVAGGVDGGWQDHHTSVSAGYSRSISDGGGFLGAVRLQNAYGTFRRELVRRWTAALTASHSTNQAITVASAASASSINLTSAGVTLEHNGANSVGFRMGYSHDFQEQYFLPSATTPTLDASRNRFFVTLSYQWAKPLGM
jgi:hypothetical protein